MEKENILLNEDEMKNVCGGASPENELVGSKLNARCTACNISYPSSYDTCPKCGKTLIKPITGE